MKKRRQKAIYRIFLVTDGKRIPVDSGVLGHSGIVFQGENINKFEKSQMSYGTQNAGIT